MQLYRPVFPLKQQGQNCSGVKRLKYNGWKDFYPFREIGSTRQMPYGLRWETRIEGLRDSKPNPENSLTKKKRPQAHCLSTVVFDTEKECGPRSWLSQCEDELCGALNALQWKNTLRAPAGRSPMPLCCSSARDAKNAGAAERGVTSRRDPSSKNPRWWSLTVSTREVRSPRGCFVFVFFSFVLFNDF